MSNGLEANNDPNDDGREPGKLVSQTLDHWQDTSLFENPPLLDNIVDARVTLLETVLGKYGHYRAIYFEEATEQVKEIIEGNWLHVETESSAVRPLWIEGSPMLRMVRPDEDPTLSFQLKAVVAEDCTLVQVGAKYFAFLNVEIDPISLSELLDKFHSSKTRFSHFKYTDSSIYKGVTTATDDVVGNESPRNYTVEDRIFVTVPLSTETAIIATPAFLGCLDIGTGRFTQTMSDVDYHKGLHGFQSFTSFLLRIGKIAEEHQD